MIGCRRGTVRDCLCRCHDSWVVFCWILLDLLVMPFPSEILLLVAGSLSASGHLRLDRIILAGLLAAVAADHLWFYLGRRQGSPAVHFLCRLTRRSSQCHAKTLNFFVRFGPAALLVAKFFPGIRTVAPSMAGASHIPYLVFLGAGGVGSLAWVAAASGLGYVFAAQIAELVVALQGLHAAAFWTIVVLLASLFMASHLHARRPPRRTGRASDD
jgi:membrane protein DedA with SNARE-associated domain